MPFIFLDESGDLGFDTQIKNRHKVDVTINIKSPSAEKVLQAVDFVSWAIFRKYEYRDDSYYNLIKSKIIEENALFP